MGNTELNRVTMVTWFEKPIPGIEIPPDGSSGLGYEFSLKVTYFPSGGGEP